MNKRVDYLVDIEQEWQRIHKKLFGQEISNRKDVKSKMHLNPDIGLLPGLDRIKAVIPKGSIKSLPGSLLNIDSLSCSGILFSKLKSGMKHGNWWCHLDINLPKVLYGNNLRNIRKKKDFLRALELVREEIKKSYLLDVDLLKASFYFMEVNKLLLLDKDFSYYKGATEIVTSDILKGNFRKKGSRHEEFQKFSGISYGTTNKQIGLYDKSLEQIYRKFGQEKWYQKITKSQIVAISNKYTTLARLEFFLKGDPLRRIIPKEITLEDFAEEIEIYLDLVYKQLLSEAGLDPESFAKRKEAKLKRLTLRFKEHIRRWPDSFIVQFLKNERGLWGVEQGIEIIRQIGGGSKKVYDRSKSLEKQFKPIRDRDGRNPNYWKELHEFMEKVNE